MLAQRPQRADGTEAGHIDHFRAKLDRGEHHRGHSKGMEQRNHAQEFVLVFQLRMLDAGVDVALEVAEGKHHTLGQPAGSAGVHQDGGVVRLGVRQPRLEVRHHFFRRRPQRSGDFRQLGQIDDLNRVRLHFPAQLGDGDDGVDAAVGDHVGDLIVAKKKIDGDHALASQQGSVETRDKSRACGEHESDVAARRGLGQIARQCAGSGGQLGKRAAPLSSRRAIV